MKINIEGFDVEIVCNAVRKTHKSGCAGYFKIKVNGAEKQVFGVWDNEYDDGIMPYHVETLVSDGRSEINEPEMSLALSESGDDYLTAEMVARELAELVQ